MIRNITFSAEEELLARAREKASSEKTSLNQRFRQWLKQYVYSGEEAGAEYLSLMKDLSYTSPGKKFSRDELNER